jgi:dienelactone hydrolase
VTEASGSADPADTGLLRLRHGGPRAGTVVLVLHGGQADSTRPARSWSPAALRLVPFVRAITAALADTDTAVASVRYRYRGWNGPRADAAVDAARAVNEAAAWPGRPRIVLVGHSMGGRAALHAAGHPQVLGVVALAPWWPPGEPVDQLRGKHLRVFHAPRDRVTDPHASLDLVHRARAAGADAAWAAVPSSDHAMLRRARTWHAVTAGAVTELAVPPGTEGEQTLAAGDVAEPGRRRTGAPPAE